jgi:hypothetical protein
VGQTRSLGDVGPMSGLPESVHGRARPNLPTPAVTLASLIAGTPRQHRVDPRCVVRMRRKPRMPRGRQPSPTGATGVTVIGRVAEIA